MSFTSLIELVMVEDNHLIIYMYDMETRLIDKSTSTEKQRPKYLGTQ